jgi:hypothetical protein
MLSTKRFKSQGYIASLVVVLLAVVATLFLVTNRQQIVDSVYVWQYQPTAEIEAIAERTSMSKEGEFLFYASRPSIEESTVFNEKCARIEQSAAILGCYDGRNIYVYNVTNPKLDGIREVTSAHEMLHAVYLRLSAEEREVVDKLVEAEYLKLSNDEEFAARMEFYARTEPGERDNELHSIIGTEVASISPELERHYKQYFDDRNKVVALHAQYASVFASLQLRSKEISEQITAIADQIEANTDEYNTGVNQLNRDIATFNARANSGAFETQAQFDAERARLTARVAQLDGLRASINDDRSVYNTLREELLSIASESDALNRSIDSSSLAPSPSL